MPWWHRFRASCLFVSGPVRELPLLHDDRALQRYLTEQIVVVEAASTNLGEVARLFGLTRGDKAYIVDSRTIPVSRVRIGIHLVRPRVVVDEGDTRAGRYGQFSWTDAAGGDGDRRAAGATTATTSSAAGGGGWVTATARHGERGQDEHSET